MQHAREDFYAKLLFRAKNLRSVTPLGRNTVYRDEFSSPPAHLNANIVTKKIPHLHFFVQNMDFSLIIVS